jgi:Helix-turn-helix domain
MINNATPNEKETALKAIAARTKGASAKTQATRLLEALGYFAINSFEAMRSLDVYHVPARVQELRAQGYNIKLHWQTVITESGEKHRVGLYVLNSGVQNG